VNDDKQQFVMTFGVGKCFLKAEEFRYFEVLVVRERSSLAVFI
jgi:hypothetical protein